MNPPMMARSEPTVLLLGIGRADCGDDAVGPWLVERIAADPLPGVTCLVPPCDPAVLIELWQNFHALVAVDAVCSGAAPGRWHRFDAHASPLPAIPFRGSTHALGLAEAIELARALGRLPRFVRVYGIEGSSFLPGTALSPLVREAAVKLESVLRAELLALVQGEPACISASQTR